MTPPMPADDGLGLDRESLALMGPEASKGYPQDAVPCPK